MVYCCFVVTFMNSLPIEKSRLVKKVIKANKVFFSFFLLTLNYKHRTKLNCSQFNYRGTNVLPTFKSCDYGGNLCVEFPR